MPKMTNRWRKAAIVMAALGFALMAVTMSIMVTMAPIPPLQILLTAATSAGIWFAAVYVIFLAVSVIRKAIGGGP